jgi:hypothetical protein
MRGNMTAIAAETSNTRSSNTVLNFNLQREAEKFSITNNRRKVNKNKIKPIKFHVTLIPKRSISKIPKSNGNL